MTADIDKALTYQVTQNAGVKAILSSRFFPIALPSGTSLPAALYQEISGVLIGVHDGQSILPKPRIQITCWGLLFSDVVSADEAIRQALDGQKGNWGTGTYITEVEACQAVSTPHDDRDPGTGLYQRSRDYSIIWKQ